MAALMGEESESSDTDRIPEYLDPKSPNFDPKRALYETSLPVSLKTAKQYNNLAEFENFLKGKDAKCHQKKKDAETLSVKNVRALAKQTESERKAAILGKVERPGLGEVKRKVRRETSVFTKMEGEQSKKCFWSWCLKSMTFEPFQTKEPFSKV